MATYKRKQGSGPIGTAVKQGVQLNSNKTPQILLQAEGNRLLTLGQVQYVTIHIEELVTACQFKCTLRNKFILKE
jgi:hypothetical protein